MQSVRFRSTLASPRSLTLITVAVAILMVMFAGWHRRSRHEPSAGIVVVRGAPHSVAKAVPSTPGAPVRVASTALPGEAAVADIRRAYPLLSDVAMECRAGRCLFTATIRPLATQDDLDRRQEMLLGGLAAALATDGYWVAVPFQMDEVADNTFHIRAHLTASDR